ncbi:hypothetical protein GCM10010260_21520 [Streptomyces filipinensis]|uniref:Uncharacterized protein n=1 Tax=Streptomyces filipinensis TaxID=66887 RepID=A0A918MAQ7_9ACTN|nr:hypothetical protein [Streptomyces filipinensis]GGU87742.1 hypothetical protein GCM10010260_21520 [Streptomyces filipinensis]
MSALSAAVPYRISGRVGAAEPPGLGGAGRGTAEAVCFLRECQGLAWR